MPFIDDSVIVIPTVNITTSVTPPSNPNLGDVWNEVDTNGYFIEKWEAISNPDYEWRSQEKRTLTEQPYQLSLTNGNRQYHLGVNNISHDCIIKEMLLNYAVLNQLSSSQTVTCELQRMIENGASFASTALDTTVISNISANRFVKKTALINYSYLKDASSKTGIRMLITASSGTSINLIFQANLTYHNYR
jgi:hypothetical protein